LSNPIANLSFVDSSSSVAGVPSGASSSGNQEEALEESSWRTQDQNNTVLYKTDIRNHSVRFSSNGPPANSKTPYLYGHTHTVPEEFLSTFLLYEFTVQM
jgi:hypothetical protein